MDWSDDDNAIVVWYYDCESAAATGTTEEEMLAAKDEGRAGEIDELEFSSVSEVRQRTSESAKKN